MILVVCFVYVAANLPKVVIKATRADAELPYLALALDNVLLLQFTGNFVVYAASNKQYREAYLTLILDISSGRILR